MLLGGEAGLHCGEMKAVEWGNVDVGKRQLCVARSDWKGHVTDTKADRARYVPTDHAPRYGAESRVASAE